MSTFLFTNMIDAQDVTIYSLYSGHHLFSPMAYAIIIELLEC